MENPEIKDLQTYELALEILKLDKVLSNWEIDFIEDIISRLEDGKNISMKQKKKIERIYDDKVVDPDQMEWTLPTDDDQDWDE